VTLIELAAFVEVHEQAKRIAPMSSSKPEKPGFFGLSSPVRISMSSQLDAQETSPARVLLWSLASPHETMGKFKDSLSNLKIQLSKCIGSKQQGSLGSATVLSANSQSEYLGSWSRDSGENSRIISGPSVGNCQSGVESTSSTTAAIVCLLMSEDYVARCETEAFLLRCAR
jgi:hypothetical protein